MAQGARVRVLSRKTKDRDLAHNSLREAIHQKKDVGLRATGRRCGFVRAEAGESRETRGDELRTQQQLQVDDCIEANAGGHEARHAEKSLCQRTGPELRGDLRYTVEGQKRQLLGSGIVGVRAELSQERLELRVAMLPRIHSAHKQAMALEEQLYSTRPRYLQKPEGHARAGTCDEAEAWQAGRRRHGESPRASSTSYVYQGAGGLHFYLLLPIARTLIAALLGGRLFFSYSIRKPLDDARS